MSLSHNPITEVAPDNPTPFEHVMADHIRSDTYRFDYHGPAVSHIDALCHFMHNGMLYNGMPSNASSKEKGCGKLGIE